MEIRLSCTLHIDDKYMCQLNIPMNVNILFLRFFPPLMSTCTFYLLGCGLSHVEWEKGFVAYFFVYGKT